MLRGSVESLKENDHRFNLHFLLLCTHKYNTYNVVAARDILSCYRRNMQKRDTEQSFEIRRIFIRAISHVTEIKDFSL